MKHFKVWQELNVLVKIDFEVSKYNLNSVHLKSNNCKLFLTIIVSKKLN